MVYTDSVALLSQECGPVITPKDHERLKFSYSYIFICHKRITKISCKWNEIARSQWTKFDLILRQFHDPRARSISFACYKQKLVILLLRIQMNLLTTFSQIMICSNLIKFSLHDYLLNLNKGIKLTFKLTFSWHHNLTKCIFNHVYTYVFNYHVRIENQCACKLSSFTVFRLTH